MTPRRLAVVMTTALAAGTSARSTAPASGQVGLEGTWHLWANADDIQALAAEGGALWAGSRHGGLVRWDLAGGDYDQWLWPQDGLTANNIRAIAIDERGWKWLATDRGLAALDDRGTPEHGDDAWLRYTVESSEGGLPTDDLHAIAVDGTTVWIGGSQVQDRISGAWSAGGLGRLETAGTFDAADDTWSAVTTFAGTVRRTPDGRETLGLVSDSIRGLHVVGTGLWVAGAPHWRYESDGLGGGSWRSVHGGLSYVAAKGTFDPADDEYDAYSCASPLRDATQRPVIGCNMGAITSDGAGNIWVSAGGLGAIAFAPGLRPLVGRSVQRFDDESGLAGSAALTVAAGEAPDEVWIGLRDAGAVRLAYGGTLADRTDDVFRRFDTGAALPTNRVQAAAAGGGAVWLGLGPVLGVGRGVVAVTAGVVGRRLVTAAPAGRAPPSNFVTDVAVGGAGSAWPGGVWIATGSRKQQRFGVGVGVLQPGAPAGRDGWSVFTASGTDGNGQPPFDGLAGDNVHAILVDGSTAWFGSAESIWDSRRNQYRDGGLSAFAADDWTARTVAAGLQDGSVSSLALGCDGRIWAGTGADWSYGRGLDVLSAPQPASTATDSWEHLGFPNLPSDNVRAIAHDCTRSEAWVAGVHSARGGVWSDGGVSRRDSTGAWRRYDVSNGFTSYGDGIVTGEGTALALDGERVWAGALGDAETTEQDLIRLAPYFPAAVNRFEDGSWSAAVFPRLGWVSDLGVDASGNLWAGFSRGGLARAGESADAWVEDPDMVGLVIGAARGWLPLRGGREAPFADVSAIHVADDGDVWLASEGWGLARFTTRSAPTPTASTPPTIVTPPPTGTEPTSTPAPTTPSPITPSPETATATPTETLPATSPTPTTAGVYLPALTNQ